MRLSCVLLLILAPASAASSGRYEAGHQIGQVISATPLKTQNIKWESYQPPSVLCNSAMAAVTCETVFFVPPYKIVHSSMLTFDTHFLINTDSLRRNLTDYAVYLGQYDDKVIYFLYNQNPSEYGLEDSDIYYDSSPMPLIRVVNLKNDTVSDFLFVNHAVESYIRYEGCSPELRQIKQKMNEAGEFVIAPANTGNGRPDSDPPCRLQFRGSIKTMQGWFELN